MENVGLNTNEEYEQMWQNTAEGVAVKRMKAMRNYREDDGQSYQNNNS